MLNWSVMEDRNLRSFVAEFILSGAEGLLSMT
jgi:hypothetical protein